MSKMEETADFSRHPRIICVICQDILVNNVNRILSCVCGNVFHEACIKVKEWLRHNEIGMSECPNCRSKISISTCRRIFLSVGEESEKFIRELQPANELHVRLAKAESKLLECKKENKKLKARVAQLEKVGSPEKRNALIPNNTATSSAPMFTIESSSSPDAASKKPDPKTREPSRPVTRSQTKDVVVKGILAKTKPNSKNAAVKRVRFCD